MTTDRNRYEDTDTLLDLVDIIHSYAEDGRPIVVPDPGTEHGRALVLALGARIDDPD